MAQDQGEQREQTWVAFTLAWVAGGVDAIGFLELARLFTAHMSGNSAATGAFAGHGQWHEMELRLFPIPLFVLGLFAGALLVEGQLRRKARSPLFIAFGLEAALLFACLLWGRAVGNPKPLSLPYCGLGALATLAMGLQNTTLRRVGKTGVRTTYISGMLTNFAEALAAYAYWFHDRTRRHGLRRRVLALRLSPRQGAFQKLGLFGGIWLSYLVGASLGSLGQSHWHWTALVFPLSALLAVLLIDTVRPVAGVSGIEQGAKNV